MGKPVVWIDLPKRRPEGHEQHGRRPGVLIFDPATVQELRFPMLLVVPVTTSFEGDPPFYVSLPAGAGGLPQPSMALLDQLCFIDAARVVGYLGELSEAEYQPIRDGLKRMIDS